MMRFALEIDDTLCWGCKTCEAACKQENRDPDGVRRVWVGEDGPTRIDGKWNYTFTVNRCRHCDDPPCATACLEGAIEKRPDTVVVLDPDACIGCGACVETCPFDAVAFDEPSQTAVKCNLCHHRLDAGLVPACADNVCLAHCIHLAVEE